MKKWLLGWALLCLAQTLSAQDILKEDSLQEVVVTGTGTQHLLKDAPVQTEVISRQMLRNFSGSSVADILSGLTSSFAFNEGDMGSQMQMNGLGNNYILILIDGKRIHGDNGGENDLSLIDPYNIEKIEIVKGASSALYGSDAIAGVINIITKKHTTEGLLLENTTRGGSYGELRQHDGVALNLGKLKSYTNFQLQHSDGWQNTSKEDPHQTEFVITDSRNKTVNRYTNWQIAEHLIFSINKDFELYADGTLYRKRIYRPSGKHPGVDVKTFDLRYNNASASVGGKWRLEGTDVITLDVDWNRHAYSYDYTAITLTDGYVNGQHTSYFPYYPGQSQLQSDQQRTMAHLKGVFTLPYENRLSTGVEWRYDWLKAPNRVKGGKATDHTGALYVQDECRFLCGNHVATHFTAGLRLNRNQQFGYRLTPKVSAMLSLGEDLRIRATWSVGFKTPTPKELYYQYVRDMNGTYLFLGNTELKPQTSDYFSLNAEYNSGGLSATVTGYYNQVNGMIALVTIPNNEAPIDLYTKYLPLKTRQYKNLESAKTYGADVTLRYRINREWTAGLGYSYLDTDAKLYDSEDDVLRNVIIDGMAHHKGNCYVTWNHTLQSGSTWGAGVYGRMSSKRYYQLNGNGKGYQIWRLTGNHSFSPSRGKQKPLTFQLEAGVDNLFNYVDKTDHGLHLGTTTPGITVYAALTIRFNHGKKLVNNYKSNSLNQTNNEDN
ncbi:MAG: TonB-dependent receptor [Bacteroidaceae bacterium]|nr:TonB-dependent receptor [Bacteroidaceae bacterium]